ncbi:MULTISPECIES: alkaline phosphatase family protein [unclassified Beijerinckia]|uniref:alkaline phosphatase family protein n=1 Tax=unclassified Beijerinckia TaxID=2638183 RepID=UPI0008963887|nr:MULTISPECIES: alkaline phosphatase family protein [unclassified Beijerinckia]MDH7799383.1 arylsulfatase A-like enzyme [Beijerinckia sp. GAS462]SED48402.1 Arylsulfatase A [Beijerinckia sp. 28-YEA-48]
MAAAKNILFIMCDQLRWDYLSCYGHPKLHTPHIDALAARGVRFTHCCVQSPVCGPSRMSTYTGRYVQSHGASWNGFPLRVGEMTMGDYLRPLGLQAALIGKTHMTPDKETMQRLGIDPQSIIGVRTAECGFDPYERDDGLWAVGPDGAYDERVSRYNQYLNQKGYGGDNPWHDYANAGENPDGTLASGWAMRHARKPARVEEPDSETPYMVGRAMDFITEAGDASWCLHLSFIKPHWPYIAPAPYNDMYGKNDIIPVVRADSEKDNAQPVYREFMQHRVSQTFSRDDVREEIIPVYMGLIKQIDDQMGRLFAFLEQRGLMDNTMIVLTSDHGDYLGDHWLGEKDLFHDPSVRVPLIIYDPSPTAAATRGTACPALVEAIDLLPTFIDAVGGKAMDHAQRLEGRSLLPFLHGAQPETWREFTISEYDYSMTQAAQRLGVAFKDTSLFMIADARWKLMHAPGFRPMLFDRENDPQELNDLGADPAYESERQRLMAALHEWGLRISQRVTVSESRVNAARSRSMRRGILIGVWDESEIPEELWSAYRGKN